jgi:type III secretion protein J
VIFEQAGGSVRDREADIKMLIKDGVPGLKDVNKVSVKFSSAPPPPAQRTQGAMPMALSSISPLALVIAALVAVALGLGIAFRGRLRAASQPKPAEKVWQG